MPRDTAAAGDEEPLWFDRGGRRRDEDPGRHSVALEGRRTLEQAVIGIEVLHENDVGRHDVLDAHEALPDRRKPEATCQCSGEHHNDRDGETPSPRH